MPIFVDALNGDDAFAGTTQGTAVKTIYHAMSIAADGEVIKILAGTYRQTSIFTGPIPDKSLEFEAKGHVIFWALNNVNAEFFGFAGGSLTANRTLRFKNIIFANYFSVVDVGYVGVSNSNVTLSLFFENCCMYTASSIFSPGSTEHAAIRYSGGGTAQIRHLNVYMQNCTVKNYDNVYRVQLSTAQTITINVNWEKNNIFDVNSTVSFINPASINTSINRLNSDHNALPIGEATIGPNDFVMPPAPNYVNYQVLTSQPLTPPGPNDLFLVRNTNTSYIGRGEFQDDIGASWWPVSPAADDTDFSFRSNESVYPSSGFFPTNWDSINWTNDEAYYDTTLGQPGIDAEDQSVSPAVLSSTLSSFFTESLDPKWIIHPSQGGGRSARMISGVFDTGGRCIFKGVDYFVENSLPTNVVSKSQFSSVQDIEYRSALNAPDIITAVWSSISRAADPGIGPQRYFQFRITFRKNGF